MPALSRLIAASAVAALLAGSGCSAPAPRSAAPAADPDSVAEAYRVASGALMWPGATRSFLVDGAGDLTNGAWRVRVLPLAAGIPADSPRVIAAEERWRPVLHWRRRSGPVRWDFEAAASPGPAARDSGLIVSLRISATNSGSAPTDARLALALVPPAASDPFAASDFPEGPVRLRWGSSGRADTVAAWCAEAASGDSLVASLRLAPGDSRELRVILPAYPEPGAALVRWAKVAHEARMDEARAAWDRMIAAGTRIEIGDREVENAWRGALVVLLSCRERRAGGWVPVGGPFHYRDTWLRDGARAVRALAVAGYAHEAVAGARALMGLQWPNGAVLSQRGQLDGTGQALWALDQALSRAAGSAGAVRVAGDSLAPAIERAARWIVHQRELGRGQGQLGAMLPYGDPRDNELVRAQLVGNDAWSIAGLEAAARLLAASHRDQAAHAIAAEAAAYRGDLERLLARRRGDVPPSWQGVGRDWGNLSVGYPCRVLPASSPRIAAMARRVWASAGDRGLATYGGPDSLHGYLGADLGGWALLAGRRAEADTVLAALLRWRTGGGGGAEIFSRAGDFGRNLPPHPTSAAALISLVRDALIEDGSDTLRLTLGAREAWWRAGRVRRAPTRWGAVDLEFRRDGDAASWRWTPVETWTALTLPPGTRVAVDPPSPLRAGGGGRVILAPPRTSQARVELREDQP